MGGCSRCGGLMLSVMLEDRESTFMPCAGLQCVNCGDIVDALITQHRAASVRPHLKNDSGPSDYRYEHPSQ